MKTKMNINMNMPKIFNGKRSKWRLSMVSRRLDRHLNAAFEKWSNCPSA